MKRINQSDMISKSQILGDLVSLNKEHGVDSKIGSYWMVLIRGATGSIYLSLLLFSFDSSDAYRG